MPGMPGGFFGSSSPRSSNEDQISGHLVEVGIYGILSLYEKFQKEEPKSDTPNGVPARARRRRKCRRLVPADDAADGHAAHDAGQGRPTTETPPKAEARRRPEGRAAHRTPGKDTRQRGRPEELR